MNRSILMVALLLGVYFTFAQTQTYISENSEMHLCGPMTLADLQDTTFSWYAENYEAYNPQVAAHQWAKKLKDTSVDIYVGTWCGDSKKWVPRFVKTWEALGLDKDQLNFIALYDDQDRYKQGPAGEEKGAKVHRVPTFIFKNEGEEIGRIVEFPSTDLVTDLAQIALGYPSDPSYRAANYLLNYIEAHGVDSLYEDFRVNINEAYKLVGKSSELNTLGYVYLRAGKVKEACAVFNFNTYFFRNEANVYDSYGEALEVSGETKRALEMYEKVLAIDPKHENALKQVALLKEEG
ncbi:MAG: tetratricopeptide (TPR) repeat protein [Marinoscillum sp.]|jgi:tetratricopeptide (TPR) repeat protein